MTKHVELLLRGASSSDTKVKAESIKLIEANRSAFIKEVIECVTEEMTIKQANILGSSLTIVENSISNIESLNEAAKELSSLAEYRWDLQKTNIELTQPLFVVGSTITHEDLSFLKEIADYASFPSNRIVTFESITSENAEPLDESTLVVFLNGACTPDGGVNSKLKKLNRLARSTSEQLWISLSKAKNFSVEDYVSDACFSDVESFMEYYKAWLQCAVGGDAELDAEIRSLEIKCKSSPNVQAWLGDWLEEHLFDSSFEIGKGVKLASDQMQLLLLIDELDVPLSLKSNFSYT